MRLLKLRDLRISYLVISLLWLKRMQINPTSLSIFFLQEQRQDEYQI